MVHTLFGGSDRERDLGWAALTRPAIASAAPIFYGGLKVLASLQQAAGHPGTIPARRGRSVGSLLQPSAS